MNEIGYSKNVVFKSSSDKIIESKKIVCERCWIDMRQNIESFRCEKEDSKSKSTKIEKHWNLKEWLWERVSFNNASFNKFFKEFLFYSLLSIKIILHSKESSNSEYSFYQTFLFQFCEVYIHRFVFFDKILKVHNLIFSIKQI